jgi:putative addiction module component (TIGR02574 family)
MSLTEIKQQASQLSIEERLELQDFLLSLEASEDLSPEWKLEVERRLEDVRSGKVQPLSHEVFWQRIREKRA